MKTWLPWILTGVAALWLLAGLPQRKDPTYATSEFGKLPVVLNGRVQPFDSMARNALLQIRNKQSVHVEGARSLSATEWLLEVMMKPETADDRKVFRIDHPELQGLLRLSENEKHFSYHQLKPHFEEISKQAERADKLPPQGRNSFERQVSKLNFTLVLYQRLKNTLRPEDSADFAGEVQQYLAGIPPGFAAFKAREAKADYDKEALRRLGEFMSRWESLAQMAYPLIIPSPHPEHARDDWSNVGSSLIANAQGTPLNPAITHYARMTAAYRAGQTDAFNQAVREYRDDLRPSYAAELSKCEHEFFYNRFQAFYQAMILYVAAFLLACACWFNGAEWMRRSAFQLVTLAWIVHTCGLVYRMVLEGRPPVTNLYSSAIFIGWGAVILGWIIERIHRYGIGIAAAALLGFTTLVIAHNLALGGDTMVMMQAVLDSNFWLATHVVVVTLGYSATFFAGFLGCIYIIRGFFTKRFSADLARSMSGMVYGTICFAMLFSFAGTVLGGIWADQSWGRFWGWDPKENGALIIVIWNAIILHARWSGLVADRGLMNMAVFGNIVTAFSWFGVNMLGVGLHAYGFMESAALPLYLFIGSQLALIGIGLAPFSFWKSGGALTTPK
jgi:ABC-type transport system involved in cytochrome c biogenesis permease subunit